MTKIQLKRIYSKLYKYNKTEIKEYKNLEELALACESKFTLTHNDIQGNNIHFPEFKIIAKSTGKGTFYVDNIKYYTKNNQVKFLFKTRGLDECR